MKQTLIKCIKKKSGFDTEKEIESLHSFFKARNSLVSSKGYCLFSTAMSLVSDVSYDSCSRHIPLLCDMHPLKTMILQQMCLQWRNYEGGPPRAALARGDLFSGGTSSEKNFFFVFL